MIAPVPNPTDPGAIRPVPVRPPDPLPVSPPDPTIRPAPPMPAPESWSEKPVIKSRTIWSIIATIAGFILAKFLGIDGVDIAGASGADGVLSIGELIWLVGAIFASWFRVHATGPLTIKPGG